MLDLLIYLDTTSLFFFFEEEEEEESVYFSLQVIGYHCGQPGQELKAGTWKEELIQSPWEKKNGVLWLAWLAFFYSPKLTCLGMALP